MSDTPSVFANRPQPLEPGADFETAVFAKIRHVKRRRRLTATIATPLALLALVSALQLFRAPSAVPAYPIAGAVEAQPKEEVPVSADVYFAASDSRTQYSVERVSYSRHTAANQAAAVPETL